MNDGATYASPKDDGTFKKTLKDFETWAESKGFLQSSSLEEEGEDLVWAKRRTLRRHSYSDKDSAEEDSPKIDDRLTKSSAAILGSHRLFGSEEELAIQKGPPPGLDTSLDLSSFQRRKGEREGAEKGDEDSEIESPLSLIQEELESSFSSLSGSNSVSVQDGSFPANSWLKDWAGQQGAPHQEEESNPAAVLLLYAATNPKGKEQFFNKKSASSPLLHFLEDYEPKGGSSGLRRRPSMDEQALKTSTRMLPLSGSLARPFGAGSSSSSGQKDSFWFF